MQSTKTVGRIPEILAILDKTSENLTDLSAALNAQLKYEAALSELKAIRSGAAKPVTDNNTPPAAHKETAKPEPAQSRPTAPTNAPSFTIGQKTQYIKASKILHDAMVEKKLTSISTMAKRTGMSDTTLRKLLQADTTVRLQYYYKAAIELDCLKAIQTILPEESQQ